MSARRDRAVRGRPVRAALMTLAVATPLVAALAVLAGNALVGAQRTSFEAGAWGETRSVLVALPEDIGGPQAAELSRALRRPGRMEVVLVTADGAVSRSSTTVDLGDVPPDLRAQDATPGLDRAVVAGDPVLVAGGSKPEGTPRVFLFFSERPLEEERSRTTLLVAVAASIALVLAAAAGWLRSSRRTRDLVQQHREERVRMAHLAHELRTPVGALVTAASLVDGSHLRRSPEELRRPVEVMQVQTRRLRAIVEDLLELSRLEAGHVEPQLEPVALDQVVSEVLSSYGWSDVVVEASGPMLVHADRQSLARMALNLIGNARRHSQGHVQVDLRGAPGGVWLEVSDDGPGMDPEHAGVLTDARRPRTTHPGTGGHGLGLLIARAHADLMGARIEVDSRPDDGTRIRVELPAAGEPTGEDAWFERST